MAGSGQTTAMRVEGKDKRGIGLCSRLQREHTYDDAVKERWLPGPWPDLRHANCSNRLEKNRKRYFQSQHAQPNRHLRSQPQLQNTLPLQYIMGFAYISTTKHFY